MPAPRRTRRAALRRPLAAALPLVLAPLGACGALPGSGSSEPSAPPPEEALSFAFELRGGEQFIDQSLTITNAGTQPLRFEAALTALDGAGEPLEDVEVETLYGSQVGGLVVVPGRDLDIVTFTGRGAEQAEDVDVELEAVEPVDFPEVTSPVEAVPVNAKGRPVTYPGLLSKVQLRNPNDADVEVRTIYIVFAPPQDGAPQQAEAVAEIAARTTVPAGGRATLTPSNRAMSIIRAYAGTNPASLKAHFVAPED
ncbi:hypothetical protein G7072_03535 [Nocardioides sp. HDW12B]|uniref:hypothetical protein n=1 Tax=Nocardioides sp. HDW12B TaxID=2714939 RepID=UPI00140926F0|nr:hypothetical protein [Nocardioides sp. HDW12B]QIK65536.1 hypothetical protein G7072_03535 [Nocardioides sp. HDW12B]